jgi:hypothetical protein
MHCSFIDQVEHGAAVRLTKGERLGCVATRRRRLDCVATRTQSVLVAQLLAEGDLTTYGRFGAAELEEVNTTVFSFSSVINA